MTLRCIRGYWTLFAYGVRIAAFADLTAAMNLCPDAEVEL